MHSSRLCVHFYISTSIVFLFLCFLFWFMAMSFLNFLGGAAVSILLDIKSVLHWLFREMCVGFPGQMKLWNDHIVESFSSYVRKWANRKGYLWSVTHKSLWVFEIHAIYCHLRIIVIYPAVWISSKTNVISRLEEKWSMHGLLKPVKHNYGPEVLFLANLWWRKMRKKIVLYCLYWDKYWTSKSRNVWTSWQG